MRVNTHIIVFAFLLSIYNLSGQINNGNLDPFGNPLVLDTTFNENDTIINKNGFFSLFKGDPGKAALYSLVIPSGGQIYNKRWWKVPLALGIDGGLTYVLINNRSQFKKAQELYQIALKEKDPLASKYKEQRDYFRKWSEYAWLWLVAGHLMTVIDAYVDRHLMDFDVSPNLSIGRDRLFLDTENNSLIINAGIKLNISKKEQKTPNTLFPSR